jgi:hypothetical protein
MDDLFFWIIVFAVLSAIGSIVWWALVAFGLFKVATLANTQFEQQMQQALALGRQLPNLPPEQRATANAQMSTALMNLNTRMRDLDALHQQQYDVKMSELTGLAASAGIDLRP